MLRVMLLSLAFLVPLLTHAQTTIQRFGNGYTINTPGQPPTTAQPFGSGMIFNTPGKPATTALRPCPRAMTRGSWTCGSTRKGAARD
jgi:hypothetical protein